MRTASVEAGHITAPDQVADLPFFPCTEAVVHTSCTHGHRGRRAETYAGAETPEVRPHRITQNTGRAQCAYTANPCNKVAKRSIDEREGSINFKNFTCAHHADS